MFIAGLRFDGRTRPPDQVKKVALFANTSWYVWNFRRRLLDELVSRGFQVIVIAPDDAYFGRLARVPADCYMLPMTRAGTNPLAELGVILRLSLLLARIRPQALLTFTPKPNIYGGLAAHAFHVPVVHNISGLGGNLQRESTRLLDILVSRLYKLALRDSRKVFFQNPEDRDGFVGAGLVNAARCAVLPGSGIDLDVYRPESSELDSRPFTFLLSARLLWSKGVGLFAAAAEKLHQEVPTCRFVLLGIIDPQNPDAVRREVVEQWRRAGIVEFFEAVEDVRPYIRSADCIVLPSVYREGTPRSLLEAAAMGKPIITTDRRGCRSVIEHGRTGFLCAPGDLEDLVKKMRWMRDLPRSQLTAFGQEARSKMEREFGDSIVLRQYLTALES